MGVYAESKLYAVGGDLYCWGANRHGLFGSQHADTAFSTSPLKMVWPGVDVTKGEFPGAAVRGVPVVATTLRTASKCSPAPVSLCSWAGWDEVHVGPTSACAVTRSWQAYCWGLNDQGALGNGTISAAGEVVLDARLVGSGRILFATDDAAISVGDGFACGMGSYVAESPDGIQLGPTHMLCWVRRVGPTWHCVLVLRFRPLQR